MVKIQSHKGQFRITIPKDIIKLMNWDKKTELIFLMDNPLNNLIIKEIKEIKNARRRNKKENK